MFSPDKKQVLAVNGEIYNHQDIRRKYAGQYEFQTGSDCEVILALYREKGIDFLEDISGIFAFALYDEETDEFLIARDPIGVIPLYIGCDADGKVYVASELKALEGQCERYEPFLPGHYLWSGECRTENVEFATAQPPTSVENSKLYTLNSKLHFKGIPYSTIIAEYWSRTGGEPQEGERNVKLHKLAANLRAICDNRREVLMLVMPRLGLTDAELQSIVDSACKEPSKGSRLMDQIVADYTADYTAEPTPCVNDEENYTAEPTPCVKLTL